MSATTEMPKEIEELLDRYPDIAEQLDDSALGWLRRSEVDRAKEVIEEIVTRGDVRNPSAFVTKAMSQFPARRDRPAGTTSAELEAILAQHADLLDSLDEAAVAQLSDADPERAIEVVEDLAAKGDGVRNPSAFVVAALGKYPHRRGQDAQKPRDPLERALQRHPHIADALDESAKRKLWEVDSNRAAEIIEEVASKDDVRNISAFVVKAVHSFPAGGGGLSSELDRTLARHRDIAEAIDESAMIALHDVDPMRASEIIEEIVNRGDVLNPSAFIMRAVSKLPKGGRRGPGPLVTLPGHGGGGGGMPPMPPVPPMEPLWGSRAGFDGGRGGGFGASSLGPPPMPPMRASPYADQRPPRGGGGGFSGIGGPRRAMPAAAAPDAVEMALAKYPEVAAELDEAAIMRLREADPRRAVEVIEDIFSNGTIRNPSAFVTKVLRDHRQALRDHPHERRDGPVDAGLERMLARHPDIADTLDDDALYQLREAEPGRAIEVIKELASRADVRNPSAFVAAALNKNPARRGPSEHVHVQLPQRPPPTSLMMGLAPPPRPPPDFDVEPRRLRNPRREAVEDALRHFPHLADELDDSALIRLREADPLRAVEIIEDVATKPDIRNPSAFVVKALADHPRQRGPQFDDLPMPMPKRMRAGLL